MTFSRYTLHGLIDAAVTVCLFFAVAMPLASVHGQETLKKTDDPAKPSAEKPPEKLTPPAPDEKSEPGSKPSAKPKSSLDDELEKALGGQPAAEAEDDPIERVIRQMRRAEQRISEKETGKETRTIQEEIVKDLDSLIELVKQQRQQQQQQASKSASNAPGQQLEGVEQARPENSQKTQSGNQNDGPRRPDGPAEESTEKIGKAKPTEADLARRERLERDVWGHLPPSVRQELLNVYSEKFLPKYEDLVRRYYEALAKQNRKP